MSPRRISALVVATLSMSGCYTWQTITTGAPQVIEVQAPSSVRITMTDGERVLMAYPVVRADSLTGSVKGFRLSDERSVPLSDIRLFEVRHTERGKTVVILVGTPLMLGLLAVLAGS